MANTKLRPGMRLKENGSIEYRFQLDGHRFSVTAKTVREVLFKEQEKRAEYFSKNYKKNKDITLDEYFDEFIKRKLLEIKPSTVFTYSSGYKNHFLGSVLGKTKIVDIERRLISIHFEQFSDNPTMYNKMLRLLHNILSEAERDEIIQKNPADNIKHLTNKGPVASETIHRALTRSEQAIFLEALKGDYYEHLFTLLLLTGIRIGEALALRWSDIDEINSCIHIRRTASYDEIGARCENSPKTRSSVRDIPLNPDIKNTLRSQKYLQNSLPVQLHDDHVFLTITGKPIITNNISMHIKRFLTRYNASHEYQFELFSVHALRDTFATRFVESGGSFQILKKILGHSTLAMTMDLYAHVLPDSKAEEMNRIRIIS